MTDPVRYDQSLLWPSVAVACFIAAGLIVGIHLLDAEDQRMRETLRPLTERIAWEQENAHLIAACVKQHYLDWRTCANAEYHTRSR